MSDNGNEEKWKKIEYSPLYEISSMGRIRGGRYNRILKPRVHAGYGYAQMRLLINGKMTPVKLHRLVAEAFIPNPENKKVVNHINTVRNDNRVENLEWCTFQENSIHGVGKLRERRDEYFYTKLKGSDVEEILKMSGTMTRRKIAKMFNVTDSNIRAIHIGITWRHIGDRIGYKYPSRALLKELDDGKDN